MPVGQVHLGIVHVFELEAPKVQRREADLMEAGFAGDCGAAGSKGDVRDLVAVCAGGVSARAMRLFLHVDAPKERIDR